MNVDEISRRDRDREREREKKRREFIRIMNEVDMMQAVASYIANSNRNECK